MTTLSDAFTGTNGAAPNASNWTTYTAVGAIADIQSNALRLLTGANGSFNDWARLVSTIGTQANVNVTVDVLPQGTAETYFRVPVRSTTNVGSTIENNAYLFEVNYNGNVVIGKSVSGTITSLGSAAISGYAPGVTVHCDFDITGTTLTAYCWTSGSRPGSPTLQVTDSLYSAAGYTGLGVSGGNTAIGRDWRVDDYAVVYGVSPTGNAFVDAVAAVTATGNVSTGAVRLYLTNSAAPYTPATVRGTWNDATATSNVYALSPTKAGTNVALSAAETSATNPYKVMLSRHVSGPLKGGQVVGGSGNTSITLTQARLQSNSAMSARVQIAAWVTVGDSDVVRGWLVNPFAGSTPFATVLTAFSFTLALDSTFTIRPGDRVVVELGYSAANAVTTSYTGTLQIGGTAADLATTGTTGVTANSPWVEFTGTNAGVAFAPYVAPVPGAFEDQTFLSFTSPTNGLTSGYHVFAADADTNRPLPLLLELHGDGAFSYLNPDSSYYLGGARGLRAVGKAKGFLVASALAPDVSGSVTWWEGGTANATYLRDLIDKIATDYSIDRTRIWFSTFSGGSQLLTEYYLPMYSATIDGGGAIIFGGGDTPLTTVVPYTAPFKANFRMHWLSGEKDNGVWLPTSGFNGRKAAEDGYAYYTAQGFATTTLLLNPNNVHDYPSEFGTWANAYLPDARAVGANPDDILSLLTVAKVVVSGSLVGSGSKSATLTAVVVVAAAGTVAVGGGTTGTATRTAAAATTATGALGKATATAVSAVAAVTAGGVLSGGPVNVTLTSTAVLTATGSTGRARGATLTVTAAVTIPALSSGTGSAGRATTAVVVASGFSNALPATGLLWMHNGVTYVPRRAWMYDQAGVLKPVTINRA